MLTADREEHALELVAAARAEAATAERLLDKAERSAARALAFRALALDHLREQGLRPDLVRLHTPWPPAIIGGAQLHNIPQNLRPESFFGPNAGLTEVPQLSLQFT